MRGFTTFADEALESPPLSDKEEKFLTAEFDGARERMTNLASTVGTAGSFVLVLVALLVGFANGAKDQSDKLLTASQSASLLAKGCSDQTPTASCNSTKLDQALQGVQNAQQRVQDVANLNKWQAVAGGLVLMGFLLGLGGILTNPVPGPKVGKEGNGVAAWNDAVDRLKLKRNWIIASLVFQIGAIIAIAVVGAEVF
jgi:hypothetical protein